jgi:ketosteroid isomerase-like protein
MGNAQNLTFEAMTPVELITRFYSGFAQRNATEMNACYSGDIIFSDPVFGLLRGDEVRAMWTMLCNRAQDLEIRFGNIQSVDEEYYTCEWSASYTFSATGKKVNNHIKAFMRIQNGRITEHSDAFRLSHWAAQALGWKGVLFGWTGFMKRSIQRKARKSLEKYMG